MLAQEDLDVVSVCSPAFLHHQHVIDAVQFAAKCHEPRGSDANEGVSNNGIGALHFCLKVDDIDEVYDDPSGEVEFINEPITLSKGVRAAYMYDPDGNIVELFDRSRMDE